MVERHFIKLEHFIKDTIVSNFQNCKQNFCSTSTTKVIDDLVRVTI
jgi:hypothetical protein